MNEVKEERLVKVSTYAKQINKSVDWVYKLIKAGKVNVEEIDGRKFIKI